MDKIELKTHKPKQPRMTSIEETVQLARIQQAATTSALYERKHNQKALKVLTVAAYILFVSMAAITLSFYYVFIWDPSTKPIPPRTITNNCDNKIIIPESMAIRLINSTEVTAEHFFKNIFRTYQHTLKDQENANEFKDSNILTETDDVAAAEAARNEYPISPSKPSNSLITKLSKSIAATQSEASTTTTTTTDSSFNEQIIAANIDSIFNKPSAVTQSSPAESRNNLQYDEDSENDDYEASGIRTNVWNDTSTLLDDDGNN